MIVNFNSIVKPTTVTEKTIKSISPIKYPLIYDWKAVHETVRQRTDKIDYDPSR
jgi:hypothetical protein